MTTACPHIHHRWQQVGLIVLLTLLLGGTAWAKRSPDEILVTAADEMIAAIQEDQDAIRDNPAQLNRLISDILLPHVDMISASRLVLGKHWRGATRAQKKQFILEFRTLLVRFYSAALTDYLLDHEVKRDMIHFQPLRAESDATSVIVRSEVIPPSGQAVPVHYHMHLRRGRWQVYDVSVEGISLITTYRSSFASEIRQHGIEGLIASLAKRNRDLLESARPVSTAAQ